MALPGPGQIAMVRSRRYLVEDVVPATGEDTLVRLSCLDDDAQGEALEVLWEREVDARVLGSSSWDEVTRRGFDEPRWFAAYLNTLRWSCVTSTDPKLFQSPHRAGIEVKAYQLEPLRKALLLPRVNLFIADDVGLGKTIEAGLILRELLMRQKVRRVVVAAPPSVVLQWRDEMDQRFGLPFVVYDRAFVAEKRRERGHGTNPWTTHSRFVVSHALLRDEAHQGPLRNWLGEFCAQSLLILDEAHNAAPASGQRYAVDSQLTHAIRELAPRFEHRLFLSATPHNGHSNSFAALLEILDPQRFCRGVPVTPRLTDAVMVRRLKSDLREVDGGFPLRRVVPVVIDGLPEDAPELRLSALLQQYTEARERRLAEAPKSVRTAAALVVLSLQKRLLSSIEAFARTLGVHRRGIAARAVPTVAPLDPPGSDDDRAELDEDSVQEEDDDRVQRASRTPSPPSAEELALLDEMTTLAERARHAPDARVRHLIGWIRDQLLSDRRWLARRVLVFTEYTDTKRYLMAQLATALADTERADDRVRAFHGGIDDLGREDLKEAFNADPGRHPLRILVCTDAAREGLNLQNHCADLFHFDIPWNPSRMEQRNGRIDRKLQPAAEVRCHYYVLAQRPEDRVLQAVVHKTERIQHELGSLAPVIEQRLHRTGIRHRDVDVLAAEIDGVEAEHREIVDEELEGVRTRRADLAEQLGQLRTMLDRSKTWLGLDERSFREAISASLQLLGAPDLAPADATEAAADPDTARWVFPDLDRRDGADPTWATTLDTLRPRRRRDHKPWAWRRETPVLPVVFRDPGRLDAGAVHLHLEHRVVQRLLGRFLAQGFVHDDLRRAAVVLTDDPTPRVLVLGRLSLYGERAARLHDELVVAGADYQDVDARGRKLEPYVERDKDEAFALLIRSLSTPRLWEVPGTVRDRLKATAPRDVQDLIPHLQRRAEARAGTAARLLAERGEREAREMRTLLEGQRKRIEATIAEHDEAMSEAAVQKRERQRTAVEKKLFAAESASRQVTMFGSSRQDDLDQLRRKLADTLAAIDRDQERQQVEADRRHWERRLGSLQGELDAEPARIRAGYEVRASRVEPVGVVYLWPVSG